MDDLLADFIAETREMLEAIGGEIVAWEADPADMARVNSIFRFIHTVKGNCGFFDFPHLARLSHIAEDTLGEVRAGKRQADRALVDAVLAAIDRIGAMIDQVEAGEPVDTDQDEALFKALRSLGPEREQATNNPPEALLPSVLPPLAASEPEAEVSHEAVAPTAAPLARSIRLPVPLLDRVMSGVSDLVLARNDLSRTMFKAGANPQLEGPFDRLSAILNELRDAVTKMRMQRIEALYNSMPRLVRDLSHELGKEVQIAFEGGDVELDREVIEMIRDPITHIVRNAIDHGLESPDARQLAQKPRAGRLTFLARQAGNRIILTISDDGAGLDVDRIARKALDTGLISAGALQNMTQQQKVDLIFLPGLSTADAVSAISGRGVGMDVVRANIEKVGGTIKVYTKRGRGTEFELQIPLTLSIISALMVSVGKMRFAVPLSGVEEILQCNTKDIEYTNIGDCLMFTFRGQRVPCLALGKEIGANNEPVGQTHKILLMRGAAGVGPFALAVEKVLNNEDLVIKPISPAIMDAGIYSGSSLLDDGRPILMLDIQALAMRAGIALEDKATEPNAQTAQGLAHLKEQEEAGEEQERRRLLIFTGYDGRQRAMSMPLIMRIDELPRSTIKREESGDHVVVNGELRQLCALPCDAVMPEKVKLLRLSDGDNLLYYAVQDLHEVIALTGVVTPVPDDTSIEGLILHEGSALPLVDGFSLFANSHMEAPIAAVVPRGKPVCKIPQNDPWSARMLRPLVEAAGYRIAAEDERAVDVAIVLDHEISATNEISGASSYLHIFSDPNEAVASQKGIFRYDRTRLICALRDLRKRESA